MVYCIVFYLCQCLVGVFVFKVYVLGSLVLVVELEVVGVVSVGVGFELLQGEGFGDWLYVLLEFDVCVVVVGFDLYFSYMKFIKVLCYLQQFGCLFVGINMDNWFLFENGCFIVGIGCLV